MGMIGVMISSIRRHSVLVIMTIHDKRLLKKIKTGNNKTNVPKAERIAIFFDLLIMYEKICFLRKNDYTSYTYTTGIVNLHP